MDARQPDHPAPAPPTAGRHRRAKARPGRLLSLDQASRFRLGIWPRPAGPPQACDRAGCSCGKGPAA
jgi:hypothetical protein